MEAGGYILSMLILIASSSLFFWYIHMLVKKIDDEAFIKLNLCERWQRMAENAKSRTEIAVESLLEISGGKRELHG